MKNRLIKQVCLKFYAKYIVLILLLILSLFFDRAIISFFYYLRTVHLKFLNPVMLLASSPYFLVILVFFAVLFLIKNKRRKNAFLLIISFLTAIILTLLLKNLFARPRPELKLGYPALEHETGYSLPSNHASSIFSTLKYMFIGSANILPFLISYVYLFLAVLIAMSRLYLGVHYPSDIFLGIIVGLFSADFIYYLGNRYQNKESKHP